MFNSNLVNASSFKMKFSNKAKLLYFYIMLNADDKGFCDNADELIILLDSNDREFHKEASLDLVEHGYKSAIQELVDKHMLLVFENKYEDKVYLVRQWYLHNQIPKDRVTETTYVKYLEKVEINSEGEYVLKSDNGAVKESPEKVLTEPIVEPPVEDVEESEDDDSEVVSNGYSDSDEDEFDYSVIPSSWGFDECSHAVKVHVMILKGEEVTEDQKRFLEAYKKENKSSESQGSEVEDDSIADDDLPF